MKTITNIAIVNDKVLITYINDMNIQLNHEVDAINLNSYNAFESELQATINAIPDIVESPVFIKYDEEEWFTVTGNKKKPVLLNYSKLTPEQQSVIDAMKFKCYQVIGEQFISLETQLGTNRLTVNNIEYDYDLFEGEEFVNAISLAFYLLDNQ